MVDIMCGENCEFRSKDHICHHVFNTGDRKELFKSRIYGEVCPFYVEVKYNIRDRKDYKAAIGVKLFDGSVGLRKELLEGMDDFRDAIFYTVDKEFVVYEQSRDGLIIYSDSVKVIRPTESIILPFSKIVRITKFLKREKIKVEE